MRDHLQPSGPITRPWRAWAASALLLASLGCLRVPAGRVDLDRLDYGQVVAESWKRQTLLNVVRLRYADTPVFLEVASIINSYSVNGKGSAGMGLPSHTDPNLLTLGAENGWSNTPTVTYQPMLGERFTKSLLQPVPPVAVFQLLQGGWPVDLVLQSVVTSINGLRNDNARREEDQDFRQLVDALTRIQRSGRLAIRVEAHKARPAVMLVLGPSGEHTPRGADRALIIKLLGLDPEAQEIEITYGLIPRSNREVALISRSMLEILIQLSADVELPADHPSAARAFPVLRQLPADRSPALVHIHVGKDAPAETYAVVTYKGYNYWIDDRDVTSKRVFTFLMMLFSLAETGPAAASPLVTVPSR